jgi:hypothetical protein
LRRPEECPAKSKPLFAATAEVLLKLGAARRFRSGKDYEIIGWNGAEIERDRRHRG